MIRFFKGLVLLPVAIVVVALAVANREVVRLSFDPFTADTPAFSLPLPLYVLIFASVAIGILCGGIGTWLGQSGTRRTSAARRREIRRLEGETERLKSRVRGQRAHAGRALSRPGRPRRAPRPALEAKRSHVVDPRQDLRAQYPRGPRRSALGGG